MQEQKVGPRLTHNICTLTYMGRAMSTVNLTYAVVTNPDTFVGFKYYVKAGDVFDADDLAESYKLNRADLDADSQCWAP